MQFGKRSFSLFVCEFFENLLTLIIEKKSSYNKQDTCRYVTPIIVNTTCVFSWILYILDLYFCKIKISDGNPVSFKYPNLLILNIPIFLSYKDATCIKTNHY